MAAAPKQIIISGIDMSFLSLVGFFVKVSLAMIPASILLTLIVLVVQSVFGILLLGAVAAAS